jgi:GTP-binding protein
VLKVRRELSKLSDKITVHAFSSLKGLGLSELSKTLDNWYLGEVIHTDPELAEKDNDSLDVDE